MKKSKENTRNTGAGCAGRLPFIVALLLLCIPLGIGLVKLLAYIAIIRGGL